jgi:hypothetical protein
MSSPDRTFEVVQIKQSILGAIPTGVEITSILYALTDIMQEFVRLLAQREISAKRMEELK